ncbi:hypothetical protein FA95DRAFT_1231769 [Auriscalpium vulgare]|uniref:Uncharacterized protein n=1 Tax=Auriscalpium vulgare TaxID=40419 RepID=A0ACB8RU69_9AGAM|nr:hypothetical protein FA95DRAFT_1231769 [Auriscalpium vulgare]
MSRHFVSAGLLCSCSYSRPYFYDTYAIYCPLSLLHVCVTQRLCRILCFGHLRAPKEPFYYPNPSMIYGRPILSGLVPLITTGSFCHSLSYK